MNYLDTAIIHFFNQFSQQSWLVDRGMTFLVGNDIVKGGIFMILFWGIWFTYSDEPKRTNSRETILLTLGGACLALFLAMVLALILSFQNRPIFTAALNFKIPLGYTCPLESWNSFPSDHAALFAALATGIWFISRPLALLTTAYLFLVILLPRIYMGLHYPSDLAAGAVLGVVCVLLVTKINLTRSITQGILRWGQKHEGLFYALFFFMTFQVATLFHSIRHIGSAMKQLIKVYL